MTAAAPLPYFTEDPAVPRRSGALTAVAVVGIVLAALMILGQAVNAGLTAGALPRNPGTSGVDAAFVLGRFARALFAVLMLLGCAGLLSLRPAARTLVIVASYTWLVLFALEATAFVYALSIPRSGQAVLRQTTGWAIAAGALASAVSGLAFPVFALVVLRRRDVAAPFALRRTTTPPHLPAIVRATAAILLAAAALWTLQAAVEWLAVAEGATAYSAGGRLFTAAVARAQPSGRGPFAVLDAALLVLLNGTLVVGCALLLARSRTGAAIVFACCVVKMAMTVASWNVGPSLLTSTAAMSRRGGPGILVLIYHWTTILTLQATSLLWPALVLAIVTHRAPENGDAAALPPPLPAPSPLPPPRRPNW